MAADLSMTSTEIHDFLGRHHKVHVATIQPDGSPHLVPVNYVMRDGRLVLWTERNSQKVRNLRHDPRVTAVVETGEHFAEFRAVQIRGRAEIVDDQALSRDVGQAMVSRQLGRTLGDRGQAYVARLAETRVVVRVARDRVVSWDHRKIDAAGPEDRHR